MASRPVAWTIRLLPGPVARAFSGFWVVPLVFGVTGGAARLAWQYAPEANFIRLLPDRAARNDPAAARAILSVVATSVMSLVSIVLSLTFVALSLTAQLPSPRMLDAVLRERAVQVLLGFALASFLFSSISLSISEGDESWRLFLAAPVSLTLAAMTLVTRVIFIHRMTLVMRLDEMVAHRVAAFLAAARRVSAPPEDCAAASQDEARELDHPLAQGDDLKVELAGYVGRIDWPEIVSLAREHDARLAADVLENDFLTPGGPSGAPMVVRGRRPPAPQARCGSPIGASRAWWSTRRRRSPSGRSARSRLASTTPGPLYPASTACSRGPSSSQTPRRRPRSRTPTASRVC